MIGTLLNVAGILAGSGAGLARRKGLSPATESFFKVALGAFTVFYGLRLTWVSVEGTWRQMGKQVVIAVLALMLGRLTGRLLRLQKMSNQLGQYARNRIEEAATGRRRDLSERARTNKLSPADITGATFTISNLGMYHVDSFTAIIVPPQAGILAVGAMTDRVVPVPGGIGVRPMMTITLSCDHRVVDGARGAAFMHDVVEALLEADKRLT